METTSSSAPRSHIATPLRPSSRLGRSRSRAAALVAAESLPLLALALYALVASRLLPYGLLQDGWLTLVAGREVADHGIPSIDTLAVWTHGAQWVDQQWLAQLAFYLLTAAGGAKLALLGQLAILVVTMGSGLAAARALGATPMSTAIVSAGVAFMAPWTFQLRAQALALPFFVWLVWLLASDSRTPSRRVYLVLPLLIVWANVHGTVVMAAGLVGLRGVIALAGGLRRREFRRGDITRGAVLTVAPVACVFASPYGVSLVGYYQTMLLDSSLREFVVEWSASTPSVLTALFYAGSLLTIWLLARHGHALTVFERAVLLLTMLSGIFAIRSIAWFGLAMLILVPRLVDRQLRRTDSHPPALALPVALTACVAIALTLGTTAARPASSFTERWSPAVADRVAELAGPGSGRRVLSDERYANWLLWERPDLRGRLAYDIRLELLDRRQLEQIVAYNNLFAGEWLGAIRGYDVVVVNAASRTELIDALVRNGFAVDFRDERIAVLLRKGETPPEQGFSRLRG